MIEIINERVEGNFYKCNINCTEETKYFFSENEFWCEYDFNVEDIPLSIMNIPIIVLLWQVCIFHNQTLKVNTIDEKFKESLLKIRDGYSLIYPKIIFRR